MKERTQQLHYLEPYQKIIRWNPKAIGRADFFGITENNLTNIQPTEYGLLEFITKQKQQKYAGAESLKAT